jgi:hypothetical protein
VALRCVRAPGCPGLGMGLGHGCVGLGHGHMREVQEVRGRFVSHLVGLRYIYRALLFIT